MSNLFGFLSKLVDRPSTLWRLAWLAFCLIIVSFFGAQTLRRIVPYVLAGVGDAPTAPLLPEGSAGQLENDGRFATWVLPATSWSILIGVVGFLLLAR